MREIVMVSMEMFSPGGAPNCSQKVDNLYKESSICESTDWSTFSDVLISLSYSIHLYASLGAGYVGNDQVSIFASRNITSPIFDQEPIFSVIDSSDRDIDISKVAE